MSAPRPIRPPALRSGDTIGIVAPGSAVDSVSLQAGCDELRRLGFRPYYLDSILDTDLYFAGTVERRVRELEHMFANPEVHAVLCARGGYGCNHLLPHLDPANLLANPKPFIGYSDVTTLLTWFTDHGLTTFHGPMATKDFAVAGGVDFASWNSALCGTEPWTPSSHVQPLVAGDSEGTLYGGCLSLLVASLGTPYEIRTEGKILFIEDVCERAYRLDRMLMQLKLAGKFRDVRGIVFGEMIDCTVDANACYAIQDVLLRIVGDLGIPIAYGLPSGHTRSPNVTLPFGVRAKLVVAGEVSLQIEPAVIAR